MVAFIDEHREGVRGRADLPRAADRPVDVLPAQGRSSGIRRGARPARSAMTVLRGDHSAHLDRAPSGVRAAEGVEADGARSACARRAAASGG